MAKGQRAVNGHPFGGSFKSGGVPGIDCNVSFSSCNFGIDPSNPQVYGCFALYKISSTVPVSTILPPYMTATRDAEFATTPKSCVIKTTAVFVYSCRFFNNSRICALIVTSSAVVGSFAINTIGFHAYAIVIISLLPITTLYSSSK